VSHQVGCPPQATVIASAAVISERKCGEHPQMTVILRFQS
jgi:hypothetical protein